MQGASTKPASGSSIVLNDISVVPEPSTWAMLGLGLAGIVLLRRLPRRAK